MIGSNACLLSCKSFHNKLKCLSETTCQISVMSSNAYLYILLKTVICDASILQLKCLMINCDKILPGV